MLSLGLGAVSSLAAGVKAEQISTLQTKVDDAAKATDLATALTRISTIETELSTAEASITSLGTSSYTSTSYVSSICTAVG